MVRYRAVVDSNEDSKGLCRVMVVAAEQWGPDPIGWVEPMFPPYLQLGEAEGRGPPVGTEVVVYEWPDKVMAYRSLATTGKWTVDSAVLCTPLERVLGMILDNLDQLNGRSWSIPSLGVVVDPVSHKNLDPVTVVADPASPAYGDARKDTEDGKLRSQFVRIATAVPVGEEG